MRTVAGVDYLASLEELVDPTQVAVIVLNMQNYLVSEAGAYAEAGRDVAELTSIIRRIELVLKVARELGVLVTYGEYITRDEFENNLVTGPMLYAARNAATVSEIFAGTWDAQTLDAVAPTAGDIVIAHSRSSAMYYTILEDVLKMRGIKSLILIGASTEGFVLDTAVGTVQYGYYATIIRDCVISLDQHANDVALAWMGSRFPMFESDEVLAAWRGNRGRDDGFG